MFPKKTDKQGIFPSVLLFGSVKRVDGHGRRFCTPLSTRRTRDSFGICWGTQISARRGWMGVPGALIPSYSYSLLVCSDDLVFTCLWLAEVIVTYTTASPVYNRKSASERTYRFILVTALAGDRFRRLMPGVVNNECKLLMCCSLGSSSGDMLYAWCLRR